MPFSVSIHSGSVAEEGEEEKGGEYRSILYNRVSSRNSILVLYSIQNQSSRRSPVTYRYYDAVLEEAIHEYDEVWTYRLKIAEGEDVPEFLPGQYAHVAAPGLEEVTKPMRRHLSIASTPADGEFIFSMDTSSHSDFKQLFLDAQKGSVIKLFKLKGEFTLENLPDNSRVIFIAGGTGITPVRSLVRAMDQQNLSVPWDLYYVGRHYLFAHELSSYKGKTNFIGRESVPLMISSCVDAYKAKGKGDLHIYLSGSHSFVEDITDQLTGKGIPSDHIRTEDFE